VFLFLAGAGVAMTAGGEQPKKEKPKEPPKVVTENKNTLIKKHRDKLKLSCSTFFNGWPVERIVDGDTKTSWFSAMGDAAAQGTKPWVMIEFPEDVTVSLVTVLGNREEPFAKGYTILSGKVEFLNAEGKVLFADENKGIGNESDFEFKPKKPVEKVRSIRFTSLKDEGDQNDFKDIAIGEIQVE
jgi:hypothetical protein